MASSWKKRFIHLKFPPCFNSVEVIYVFSKKSVATPGNIIQLLKNESGDDTEREYLGFLKGSIRGLDDSYLKKFLIFTAGSDLLTIDEIKVKFHHFTSDPARNDCSSHFGSCSWDF